MHAMLCNYQKFINKIVLNRAIKTKMTNSSMADFCNINRVDKMLNFLVLRLMVVIAKIKFEETLKYPTTKYLTE